MRNIAVLALLAALTARGFVLLDEEPEPPRFPDEEELSGTSFYAAGSATAEFSQGLRRGVTVETPVLVPLGAQQESAAVNGSVLRARRFVFSALDANKAGFLLYPFNFTHKPGTVDPATNASVVEKFPDGAFVSTLDADEFPDSWDETYFRYIESKTDIDLSRAQAVYDSSIAILYVTNSTYDEQTQTTSTIDWTYEGDYYCNVFFTWLSPKHTTTCFRGLAAWETYLAAYPTTHEATSVVFLTPGDIASGGLKSSSKQNRFGLLILPDITETAYSAIAEKLSPIAATIRQFVSDGGSLMTGGKAAWLLSTLGLASTTVFDTNHTIRRTGGSIAPTVGCNETYYADSLAEGIDYDFMHRTLCFGAFHDSALRENTTLLAGAIVNKLDSDMHAVSWFDTNSSVKILRYDHDGVSSSLPKAGIAKSYPSVMYKRYGGGLVVSLLSNPAYSVSTSHWVYNVFLAANSRPLALDNDITGGVNRTVPALEVVRLQASLKLTNYFTDSLAPIYVTVWYRTGVDVSTTGACTEVTGTSVPTPPLTTLNSSRCFNCSISALPALSVQKWGFTLDIYDVYVTQDKTDILMLYPRIEFTDIRGIKRSMAYSVVIQAAMAALLRADMNIDPSSTYPLPSKGSYVDNVMNCENKEETTASRVRQISIVPLVVPAIDADDQVRVVHYVEFDPEYYRKRTNRIMNYTYPYPGVNPGKEYDYLDFQLLYNRSGMLAASWDEAVKIFRIARSDVNGSGSVMGVDLSGILNANYQTNNEDDRYLLKQVNFQDSDTYYEHATQRMMAFLDVYETAAAATYWNGSIPESQRASTNTARGKLRVLFIRNDIYFYKKYHLPLGINDTNTLISIDKYVDPSSQACITSGKGTYSVAGHFGSQYSDGMSPREWPNVQLLYCSHKAHLINPLNDTRISLTHIIMPVSEDDIKEPLDLYGFGSDGKLTNYPEVEFDNKVYQATFDVSPGDSRQGGELIFTFPSIPWSDMSGAIENGYVTFAADQIAVYKTWADSNNKIHVRFKRGNMPNEAYGQASHLKMHLEKTLYTTENFTASFDLYALTYDISSSETGYEDFDTKSKSGVKVTFRKLTAYRLPALKFEVLVGSTLNDSTMPGYEFLEPMVRYGIYEQELASHRAVYGSAEIHPKSEPSLVTKSGGWSAITHVGTSSIPFREYLTTGTSQIIPAAPETGRVEWQDIWGRSWAQPVRSTIFEYVPIPPPLRNFVMTTTFEIIDSTGKILMDWPSDTNVTVHVQMKLLNNYPKWFEITTCKENEVRELCGISGKTCEKTRVFDTDWSPQAFALANSSSQYWKIGHNASYGICFRDPEVWLSGTHVDAAGRALIQTAQHCAQIIGEEDTSCEELKGSPTVSIRTDNSTGTWNFATQVENYWPKGYIKSNMWDMTHYDYDNSKYDKAYKYHMDNSLPHLTYGVTKPENIIAFPLYKGLGYQMTYSSTYGHSKFPGKTGWWSDNLQNRDDTVVAGQSLSNNVSVGKASLLDKLDWIDITELENAANFAPAALKNFYTCEFNRRQPKMNPSSTLNAYLKNVYENNIIPIPPNIANTDWLTNYNCSKKSQYYNSSNIGTYPNILYTDSARDWLYFGANLRGGAKENINVLYTLQPLTSSSTKLEGTAKIQDGGRFTYWNPANSRNSFLVVDNAVSTVMAIRNDVTITQELIPQYSTTFDAVVYHHLVIEDAAEDEREWDLSVFVKHHGYGDFAVSVYVGQEKGSAIMNPGVTTRIKYTFSNNAGFDINLKATAIESTEIGSEAISANDLMYDLVHSLKTPTKYNFMTVTIPDELKKYVSIAPSTDVSGIAPLFFDFENINVATIRDGWKGDYYYDLTVLSTFPDKLRGRMNQLNVSLNFSQFDCFPGLACDPTKSHKYTVEMPPILFGVPYVSTHPKWAGKVFKTSGYATGLNAKEVLPTGWAVTGARIVSLSDIDAISTCLGTGIATSTVEMGEYECMDAMWESIARNSTPINFTQVNGTSSNAITFPGLMTYAPKFPIPVDPVDGPDKSKIHLLVRTAAAQVAYGYPPASYQYTALYNDWMARAKTDAHVETVTIHAKGAWLQLSWAAKLSTKTGLVLAQQILKPEDDTYALLTLTVRNVGDSLSYNTDLTVTIPSGINVIDANNATLSKLSNGNVTMKYSMDGMLPPGSASVFTILVEVQPDSRNGAGASAKYPLNVRTISSGAVGEMDLTSSAGERRVKQSLAAYTISYSSASRDNTTLSLTGRTVSKGKKITLHCYSADVGTLGLRSVLWRIRAAGSDTWTTFDLTSTDEITVVVKDCQDAVDSSKVDFACSGSNLDVSRAKAKGSSVTIVAESNVWEYRENKGNHFLVLLLIPFVMIPAASVAVAFLLVRGRDYAPSERLGYGEAKAFVPSLPVKKQNKTLPPPPPPQEHQYTPPAMEMEPQLEPPVEEAPVPPSGPWNRTYAGPTYIGPGCKPVNVRSQKDGAP